MDILTRSENYENEDIWDFGKVRVRSCQFNVKQNNYTELLPCSKFEDGVQMGPQTPTGPQSGLSLEPL